MARSRDEGPVTLSILDRLVDELPKESQELPLNRSKSLDKFKQGVRRDIEWLLNTRQPLDAGRGEQLQDSLYAYGLPDITSLSVTSTRDRLLLTKSIEEAIAKFEPRIANPRVSLVPVGDEKTRALRFIIEGMLRVDPSPEPVSFDTVLDLASGEYRVPGETSAR